MSTTQEQKLLVIQCYDKHRSSTEDEAAVKLWKEKSQVMKHMQQGEQIKARGKSCLMDLVSVGVYST